MSNDLTVLDNNTLVQSDAYKRMLEETSRIASGGNDSKRISIRGMRFREMLGGTQARVNSSGQMNVVFIKVSPVGRTFYDGAYDADNPSPPTCWSADGNTPAADVPTDQKQAKSCAKCAQNIKGSGQGESRACRFSVRAAVCIEGDYENVYQMSIPATSYFGKEEGNDRPLQAYTKLLKSRQFPLQGVVTTMYFDENSETPKLFFKPARVLEADEFAAVNDLFDNSEEVEQAVTMTVYQTDTGSKDIAIEDADEEEPAPPKTKAKAKVEEAEEVEEAEDTEEVAEEVEPPKRRATKPKPTGGKSLSSMVAAWDD